MIVGLRKHTYPICMQCSEICCNEEDRTRFQGVILKIQKNKKQNDEKVKWNFFIKFGKGEEKRVVDDDIYGKTDLSWLAVFLPSDEGGDCRFRLSSVSSSFPPIEPLFADNVPVFIGQNKNTTIHLLFIFSYRGILKKTKKSYWWSGMSIIFFI